MFNSTVCYVTVFSYLASLSFIHLYVLPDFGTSAESTTNWTELHDEVFEEEVWQRLKEEHVLKYKLMTTNLGSYVYSIVKDEAGFDTSVLVGTRGGVYRISGTKMIVTDQWNATSQTDNAFARFIVIDYKTQPKPSIISCGYDENNICRLHNYTSLNVSQVIGDTDDPVNKIMSNNISTIITSSGSNNMIFFIYQQYDGRSLIQSPPFFSTRILEIPASGPPTFRYASQEVGFNSSFDIHPRLKQNYGLDISTDFIYGDFLYVVLTSSPSSKDSRYGTRLGRVPLYKMVFTWYEEIELLCKREDNYFSYLTAAYLESDNNRNSSLTLLVGSFMKVGAAGDKLDYNAGSVFCIFSMETILQKFQEEAMRRGLQEEITREKLEEKAMRQHLEKLAIRQETKEKAMDQELQEEAMRQNSREESIRQDLYNLAIRQKKREEYFEYEANRQKFKEEAIRQKLEEEAIHQKNREKTMRQELQEEAMHQKNREEGIQREKIIRQKFEEEAIRQKKREEAMRQELQEQVLRQNSREEIMHQGLEVFLAILRNDIEEALHRREALRRNLEDHLKCSPNSSFLSTNYTDMHNIFYRKSSICKEHDEKDQINSKFCWIPVEHRVSKCPLESRSVWESSNRVYSIVTHHQGDNQILFYNEHGYITKVIIPSNKPPYLTFKQSISHHLIRSPVLSKELGENKTAIDSFVYFGVKDNVVKFPLTSCSIYRTCASCLSSNDPLGCGWCGTHCARRSECSNKVFTHETCPPIVYGFHPQKAPLAGGTILEIRGQNFGSSIYGSLSIAGVVCSKIYIKHWDFHKIVVTVPPSTVEATGPIKVSVFDQVAFNASYSNWTFYSFGTSISNSQFMYTDVSFSRPTPKAIAEFLKKQWYIPVMTAIVVLLFAMAIAYCILSQRKGCQNGECTEFENSNLSKDTNEYYKKQMDDIQTPLMSSPLVLNDSLKSKALDLLQEDNMLIAKDRLILGNFIGEGHFGRVYKAQLWDINKEATENVAVKTLQTSASSQSELNIFIKEALIMKDLCHPRVLHLVGVSFLGSMSPVVVTPYMANGDLLTFLRNDDKNPKVRDLIAFATEIAEGMQYLANKKFVHRDLAARNCLLDHENHIKIADFGLSKDVYERNYYRPEDKGSMPVKWMAPESLENSLFTTKSDVWSFGVTFWEIITRGLPPYNGIPAWHVIHLLKAGERLGKPEHCPASIYELMTLCWSWDPNDRPTFTDILQEIHLRVENIERKGTDKIIERKHVYVNVPNHPYYYLESQV